MGDLNLKSCRKERPHLVVIFEGCMRNFCHQVSCNNGIITKNFLVSVSHFLNHHGLKTSISEVKNLVFIHNFLENINDDQIKLTWITARFNSK